MLISDTRAWVEIELGNIRHNVDEIQKLIPAKSKIMAIVKANAYGHGDVMCARELERCGIDFFGVSSIDEAIVLREGGITQSIIVLGYTPSQHFAKLAKHQIMQTLLSVPYAAKLDAFCEKEHVCIQGHVKIDTGMSRLGIICQHHEYHIDDVLTIYRMKHLKTTGIFSHFSVSDGLDEDNTLFTQQQIVMFDNVLQDIRHAGIDPGTTHLQNSYGILNYPQLSYDYVRPGLLWMGVTSNDELVIKTQPQFQPILAWKANVSMVKTIQANVYVSYGRHFKASNTRRIATVSMGYADGYPRCLSNQKARALIHGQYATIVGNICMDQMMIDVTDIDNVQEGDVVTFIGNDQGNILTIDEITRAAHTINNETLCWINSRVPRIYK